MKKNSFMSFMLALIMCFGFSVTALANSSWVWISESRPYDVLPIVAVITLVAETYAIAFFGKIESKSTVFLPVLIGNILSFITPYLFYSQTTPYAGAFSLGYILERGPFYTVGTHFLVMTLIAELPVVFLCLRKKAENSKALAIGIVAVNILTTLLTAFAERLLCQGHW